jgi:exoribonuclease-2
LPRGAQVLLRLSSLDDITLDVSGQFLALRDAGTSSEDADDETEDDSDSAGPLTIAVSLDDADTPAAEGAGTP